MTQTRLLPGSHPRFQDTRITDLNADAVLVEWKGDRTPRQVAVFGGLIGYARDGTAVLSGSSTTQCWYERLRDGPEMATLFWREGSRPDLNKVLTLLRPLTGVSNG